MRFFKLATLLKNFRTSLNNCFKIMGKTGGAYWKEGAFIDGCAHEVFLEQSVTLFRLKVILKAFYLLKQQFGNRTYHGPIIKHLTLVR